MKVIVSPQKRNYRLMFIDWKQVRATGYTELSKTPKGVRPVSYRIRWAGKKDYRNTPTRDLVMVLRNAEIQLVRRDQDFEAFLHDLQIPFSIVRLCRVCAMEDRVTLVDSRNGVRYGKEEICMDCAKRELRREVAGIGRIGRQALHHLETVLEEVRDVDRVLATLQTEEVRMERALFDRLEAHSFVQTSRLSELSLPEVFVRAAGVDRLMPVQQLAVDAGLLTGRDLLIVAATASGKTFVGELAGLTNHLAGRGHFLFLVPLVALAVQKFERFTERYGKIAPVSIIIGKERLRIPGNRPREGRNPRASIIVGTYEGVDHLMRVGSSLPPIGTVVIDEVQMLEDPERGHRIDGLIARLRYLYPEAQFLYLSATIGLPKTLAKKLDCQLVSWEDRPVSLERYLLFMERKQKIPTIRKLVREEYAKVSEKGFHGQTIVFTHSRARCHVIAEALGDGTAAYHAGLTSDERRGIEERFAGGKIMAVITTAALGAGVDFPASQVVFDSLAMGISWLSVAEFNQMAGRAGRPDFHDLGKVIILAEPGASYMRGSSLTEDEVALQLLKGDMGEVAPVHNLEQSSEEFVANAVVAKGSAAGIDTIERTMVGESEPVKDILKQKGLISEQKGKIFITDMARVMSEHFIGIERLELIIQLIREKESPVAIVAELDCITEEESEKDRPKRKDHEKRRAHRRMP